MFISTDLKQMQMEQSKREQLYEQIKEIRQGNDFAKSIIINATSGEVEIKNSIILNNILDYLLKELRLSLTEENE